MLRWPTPDPFLVAVGWLAILGGVAAVGPARVYRWTLGQAVKPAAPPRER